MRREKMKKIFLCVVFIFTLTLFLNGEDKPEKIILGFEDAPNYPWLLPDGTGITFELLKIVEAKMGIKFVYEKYPWKRCLELLKENKIDGALNSSFKKERMEMGAYPMISDTEPDISKRIHMEGYSLYRLKGSNINWDGKIFLNVKGTIGAQTGFSIVDKLKKDFGLTVDDSVKSVDENFNKLLKNRIVGAVLQTSAADFVLENNKQFKNKIEKVEPSIEYKAYYIMLSYDFIKKYPDVAKKFWNTVAEVRESKEFIDKKKEYLKKSINK